MKDYEFYRKYANLPLDSRDDRIETVMETLTPNSIYTEMNAIDNKIRNDIIRKGILLSVAEKYFNGRRNSKATSKNPFGF